MGLTQRLYQMSLFIGMQVREMGACGFQFVDVPKGFFSSAVVPYNPNTLQLDENAAIDHISNKYCGQNTLDGLSFDIRDHFNQGELMCTVESTDLMFT